MSRRRSTIAVVVAALVGAGCSSRPPVTQSSPPPVVTFEAPAEGSYLHGSVAIAAKAVGTGKISSFKFDAPAALAGAVATVDPVSRTATLAPTLDLSVFPDGPLALSVTAKDEFGGSTSKTITINVASKAPTVVISSPNGNSTVRGSAVAVTATAAAQSGAAITKLEIIDPPLGMGANTSAAAALFAAVWNTTAALEGPVTLHFRATDSTGLTGDASISVTVDNVAQSQLDTHVFAGAPVKEAIVEVWALSDATGGVDTTAGVNGLLGTGGPTDASGHVVVTLSAENYSGPIQLRARAAPGSTLQYVDPSDPGNGFIQIPSNLPLTSIVATYTAGAALTTPISLTTTLADAELLAYAAGNHRLHPGTKTLVAAAAFGDGLFTQHIQASTPRWALRSTVPFNLSAGPTTLTDRAYASFIDIALNQLAKDLTAESHITGVINAPYLLQRLIPDLSADGQFDGKGEGGTALTTDGSPPYALDEGTLRVRLANALDSWVQSVRNVSTLDRSSLAGAGVYTTISGDTSELFGPAAPVAFDNAPPSVSVVVTYGLGNLAPYGGAYVAGTAKIIITAADASGVKSVSAKLGNQILDSGATTVLSPNGQSLTYTVSVNTASYADMTYTLSVTASDQRNNLATTTPTSLTVDNTAPSVLVAQPSESTYYSALVPFDATASDGAGAGIESLTLAGVTGCTDVDPTAAHVVCSWSTAGGVADGTTTATWTTCDNVGNCASPTTRVLVDRTAPSVALSGVPSGYTNQNVVSLSVTASDVGAGVAAVYAQAPGDVAHAGVLSGGVWTIPNIALVSGRNIVSFWATDNASPANGSSSTGGSTEIIRDFTAPTADLLTAGSYRDERGLLVSSTNGVAVTPPVYSFTAPTSAPVSIGPNGHIYKAASRLAWSSVPTASSLEGVNPDNIPFLQFSVTADPTSQAPITSAQYQVTVSCATCATTATAWLDLLVSSVNAGGNGKNIYDLPMSTSNIPALANLPSAATVTVSVKLTDAASNSTTSGPWSFTWHTVGDPLTVSTDTSYATAGDYRASWSYTGSNYGVLFDTSSTIFLPDQVIRLQRYIVSNPASVPVAVPIPSVTGTWSMTETWDPYTAAVASRSYMATGMSCDLPVPAPVAPCTATQAVYVASGSATDACGAVPPHATNPTTTTVTPVSSSMTTIAYQFLFGAESAVPAGKLSGSYYVVPPASGGQPGAIAIYVGRSVSAGARSGAVGSPLGTWTGSTWYHGIEDAWTRGSIAAYECCISGYSGCDSTLPRYTWTGKRYGLTLRSGATETASHSFAVLSFPSSGSAVYGESTTQASITTPLSIPH